MASRVWIVLYTDTGYWFSDLDPDTDIVNKDLHTDAVSVMIWILKQLAKAF